MKNSVSMIAIYSNELYKIMSLTLSKRKLARSRQKPRKRELRHLLNSKCTWTRARFFNSVGYRIIKYSIMAWYRQQILCVYLVGSSTDYSEVLLYCSSFGKASAICFCAVSAMRCSSWTALFLLTEQNISHT